MYLPIRNELFRSGLSKVSAFQAGTRDGKQNKEKIVMLTRWQINTGSSLTETRLNVFSTGLCKIINDNSYRVWV